MADSISSIRPRVSKLACYSAYEHEKGTEYSSKTRLGIVKDLGVGQLKTYEGRAPSQFAAGKSLHLTRRT